MAIAPVPEVAPSPAAQEWDAPYRFERVLDKPVHSLALGRAPYAAVLSDQPWMFDGTSWKELSLPPTLALADVDADTVGIFFGRDDKPRIMGARTGASNTAATGSGIAVYYRWRGGRWERDKGEIGRLGGEPAGGLYGVLGDDDPELVCKVGDVCIVKRRTGWKTIAAGRTLGRTWLCQGTAWVLAQDGMTRLEADAWVNVPWSFDGKGHESGFWADENQRLWVTAASSNAIYRSERGTWSRVASPVREPSALWGSSASDVWVVGRDGVGHFDGASWRRVRGISEPFRHVRGRAAELWLAGPNGVWRGVRG